MTRGESKTVGEEGGKPVKGPDPILARIEELDQKVLRQLELITEQLGVPGVIPPAALTQADLPLPVVALPRGSVRAFGNITTTASFQTVTKYLVTQGKKFNLAKIVASCLSDYEVQLFWKGSAITVIYKIAGKSPFTDWFPSGYGNFDLTPILGDGTSVLELKGRFPSGGSADDLWGEIVGEET